MKQSRKKNRVPEERAIKKEAGKRGIPLEGIKDKPKDRIGM